MTEDREPDPDGRAVPDAAPAAPAEVDYDALRDQLARSVARICPAWLHADRDDVIQTAMLRIMKVVRASEYHPVSPESYLWKVAFTAVMNEIRRVRRRRESSIEEALVPGRHPVADPDRDDERRDLGAAIQRCLARLNERRRAAVALHLTGHTVDEVTGLLNWNRKRVQNLIARGIADLRLCLRSRGLRR